MQKTYKNKLNKWALFFWIFMPRFFTMVVENTNLNLPNTNPMTIKDYEINLSLNTNNEIEVTIPGLDPKKEINFINQDVEIFKKFIQLNDFIIKQQKKELDTIMNGSTNHLLWEKAPVLSSILTNLEKYLENHLENLYETISCSFYQFNQHLFFKECNLLILSILFPMNILKIRAYLSNIKNRFEEIRTTYLKNIKEINKQQLNEMKVKKQTKLHINFNKNKFLNSNVNLLEKTFLSILKIEQTTYTINNQSKFFLNMDERDIDFYISRLYRYTIQFSIKKIEYQNQYLIKNNEQIVELFSGIESKNQSLINNEGQIVKIFSENKNYQKIISNSNNRSLILKQHIHNIQKNQKEWMEYSIPQYKNAMEKLMNQFEMNNKVEKQINQKVQQEILFFYKDLSLLDINRKNEHKSQDEESQDEESPDENLLLLSDLMNLLKNILNKQMSNKICALKLNSILFNLNNFSNLLLFQQIVESIKKTVEKQKFIKFFKPKQCFDSVDYEQFLKAIEVLNFQAIRENFKTTLRQYIAEIKEKFENNHDLDISEAIRSIFISFMELDEVNDRFCILLSYKEKSLLYLNKKYEYNIRDPNIIHLFSLINILEQKMYGEICLKRLSTIESLSSLCHQIVESIKRNFNIQKSLNLKDIPQFEQIRENFTKTLNECVNQISKKCEDVYAMNRINTRITISFYYLTEKVHSFFEKCLIYLPKAIKKIEDSFVHITRMMKDPSIINFHEELTTLKKNFEEIYEKITIYIDQESTTESLVDRSLENSLNNYTHSLLNIQNRISNLIYLPKKQ